MARIRTIKPEFWSSEQVMECSPIARLLFIGLWNFCDDAGNHVASAKTIKAEIFPADDIDSESVRRLLDELSSNDLIAFYSHGNKDFLHINGWRHQKIDRPTFKYPPFTPDDQPPTRRTLDDQSPPEGKGREGKGEEGKIKSTLSSSPEVDDATGEQSKNTLQLVPPTDIKAAKAERLRQVTADAVAAFNAKLGKPNGKLSAVHLVNEIREGQVKRCLKTASAICVRLYESPAITPQFWTEYFAECAKDKFLSGDVPGGRGHENYTPDFELLTRPAKMTLVFDKAMSEDSAA